MTDRRWSLLSPSVMWKESWDQKVENSWLKAILAYFLRRYFFGGYFAYFSISPESIHVRDSRWPVYQYHKGRRTFVRNSSIKKWKPSPSVIVILTNQYLSFHFFLECSRVCVWFSVHPPNVWIKQAVTPVSVFTSSCVDGHLRGSWALTELRRPPGWQAQCRPGRNGRLFTGELT